MHGTRHEAKVAALASCRPESFRSLITAVDLSRERFRLALLLLQISLATVLRTNSASI
jgi:hypothetical protein